MHTAKSPADRGKGVNGAYRKCLRKDAAIRQAEAAAKLADEGFCDDLRFQIAEKRRAIAALSSDLSLDHDVTVSIQIVPLAQFLRYADFLPFYQNVLKDGIRYAS